MIRWNPVGARAVVPAPNRQPRARRHMRLEMPHHQRDDLARILIGHQPAGDLRVRLARDHGLLPGPL